MPFIFNPGPQCRLAMLQHPPKNYCQIEKGKQLLRPKYQDKLITPTY